MKPRKCTVRTEKTRAKPYRATWLDADGKRRFKDFELKRKAQVFAADKNREMSSGVGALSEPERLLILHVRKQRLDPVQLITGNQNATTETVLIPDAVEMFLAECKRRDLRPQTRRNAATFANAFAAGKSHLHVGEINAAAISDWITARYGSEVSRRSALSYLRMFFVFCRANGWCQWDTIDRVTWTKRKSDKASISFLRAPQVAAFLASLQENLRPAFALAFFAGIRPDELTRPDKDGDNGRLQWSDIDAKARTIIIRPEVAKTRTARTLYDLPDNLWQWLPKKKHRGPVNPINPRNTRKARQTAYKSIGMTTWPHDIARHSFASHAYWRGYEWAVSIMGHTGGPDLFFRHYRANVSESDSQEYFNLLPK
jgi:integrase